MAEVTVGWMAGVPHSPSNVGEAGRHAASTTISMDWRRRATTAAHYDVMDNAFVQLHGRKRFRIWGPEALAALKVFPDLHPRARKTQLDMSSASVAALDLANEIVLEPGDVLHLPAFTFHQVEALDMSVSANVFSCAARSSWTFSLCPFLYAVAVGLCLMLQTPWLLLHSESCRVQCKLCC